MATKTKRKTKSPARGQGPKLSAATADRHKLYEASVQNVESEIDFVDETFEKIRGRKAVSLREDFGGTANTACEWVRRREGNTAIALDLDRPTLDWGMENNVSELTDEQKERIQLLERDVRTPGDAVGVDVILSMNFSYWLFTTRAELKQYFESVRESLGDEGIYFLDHYGGSESMAEQKDKRVIEMEGPPYGKATFTYVWDQEKYNPITGDLTCAIHFHFKDGTKLKDAFRYQWRLWTLPEIRELLIEAGFKNVTVYWEGEDEDGEGDGEFEATLEGEADPAFIAYLTAEK